MEMDMMQCCEKWCKVERNQNKIWKTEKDRKYTER